MTRQRAIEAAKRGISAVWAVLAVSIALPIPSASGAETPHGSHTENLAGPQESPSGTGATIEENSDAPAAADKSEHTESGDTDARRAVGSDVLEKYLTKSPSSVYFVRGSLILTGQSLDTIAQNAQRLKNSPEITVTLVGYIEDMGSQSYSVALAERRAAIVKEALADMGVPVRQVRSAVFGGEPSDTVPCQTEICRTSYRRVEFVYAKPK